MEKQLEQVKVRLTQVRILMLPHSLNNFEIKKVYQCNRQFNGIFSRNNFSKIKNGHNMKQQEIIE